MNTQADLRYLVLFVTGACNLSCRYCYAASTPIEAMPIATAARALDLSTVSDRRFHVQLTGGEPTLAPDAVAGIVSMIRKRRPNATIGIQTNGTLLAPEMIDVLVRHRVEIGLSIDGIEPVHDAQRGMFKETLRGLLLLSRNKIPCRITTVVTKKSAPHLDKLALMLSGFPNVRGIGLDLLTMRGNAISNAVSPTTENALREGVAKLREALAFVNRTRPVPLTVRELDTVTTTSGVGCRAASGESLAVFPDGRLFPCSQTAGDPAFAMGNLNHEAGHDARSLGDGPDCPSRTHYNRGDNLPLCRLFISKRMP